MLIRYVPCSSVSPPKRAMKHKRIALHRQCLTCVLVLGLCALLHLHRWLLLHHATKCQYHGGVHQSWDPARPLEESHGPFGPKIPEESPKEFPGPSGPGAKKCPNSLGRVSRDSKKTVLRLPETLPRLSGHFLDPREKARETLSETLRGFRGDYSKGRDQSRPTRLLRRQRILRGATRGTF